MATYQEERAPGYRWVVIGTLTFGVATALTSIFFIGLLLPDISEELSLSPSQQGWLGASVVFGNLVFAIPINLWLSRYRPWRVATLSFLGIGAFTLLQGWSPNFEILIVGRVGLGISFMANQAPRALIIQQWTPARRMSFTQGVVFGTIDIVMGVAFFLTPLLLDWLGGWRNTLYLMGGMGILSALVWMILGGERVTGEYRERMESQFENPLLAVLKYKQLWVMGIGMGITMVAQTAFEVFWPTFAEEGLGVSTKIAGVVFGIMQLVAGPTIFLVNAIPALARRQTLVLAACGVATVGANLGLLFVGSVPALLLMPVVRGLFSVYFPVLMLMVYQLPGIRPREVAAGIAFMQTSVWIGAAIGPLLVGFLQEATGDLRMALLATVFTPLVLVLTAAIIQGQRSEVTRKEGIGESTIVFKCDVHE